MGRNYMLDAWAAKAEQSRTLLLHMASAPALFKPEYVEETYADHQRAMAQVRYWATFGEPDSEATS